MAKLAVGGIDRTLSAYEQISDDPARCGTLTELPGTLTSAGASIASGRHAAVVALLLPRVPYYGPMNGS